MGQAYRLVRPQLTLEDIVAMKGNTKLRLTTSPFGVTPEQYANNAPIYVGSAVAWKGASMSEIEAKFPGVARGLKNAISISKKYAGVRGTVMYNGKVYPKKAIEQKKR